MEITYMYLELQSLIRVQRSCFKLVELIWINKNDALDRQYITIMLVYERIFFVPAQLKNQVIMYFSRLLTSEEWFLFFPPLIIIFLN